MLKTNVIPKKYLAICIDEAGKETKIVINAESPLRAEQKAKELIEGSEVSYIKELKEGDNNAKKRREKKEA